MHEYNNRSSIKKTETTEAIQLVPYGRFFYVRLLHMGRWIMGWLAVGQGLNMEYLKQKKVTIEGIITKFNF